MTFDDLERWARGHGLEAVLIATGSVLLARFVRWTADRLVARSQQRDGGRALRGSDRLAPPLHMPAVR